MLRLVILVVCALIATLAGAAGQEYPNKPIRFILPYPPGGVTDVIARILGHKMAEQTGQQVIIDTRGGGASIVGTELAARAAPDGYTMMLGTFGFAVTPSLHTNLPYDTVRDFASVSFVANGLVALVVHPSLPAKSVKELIALAKAKPGALNYGSTGGGSSSNLGALLFQSLTGTRMMGITYSGTGPSLIALMGAELHMIFCSMIPAVPHIKSGKLRALGVSSIKRSNALPDVPTIAEAGVPGYELNSWYGILVPGKTPKPIITTLNKITVAAVNSQEVQEKLTGQGLEPASSTPEELSKYIASEVAKWSKVIKELGAQHD